MARGHGQRRHAKAVKRKKVLADRRRQEAAGAGSSLAQRARRAASAPVHACYVANMLFDAGFGMVILIRKTGARRFATGGFLVDSYCLGVKDVLFNELNREDLEGYLGGLTIATELDPVEPAHARKLLREAVAYAQSLGVAPHPDYAAVELLFGDADADACDAQFVFGRGGRPLYVPGPDDSATQIRRRLEQLRRTLGDAGFDFEAPLDDLDELDLDDIDLDELEDDDDLEEDDDVAGGGYDPLAAPDPKAWLALDEHARLAQVEAHHRRKGVSLPNEHLHATVHVIVENQVALGDELPVPRTVARLMTEGLDRHEAIHAVGEVLFWRLNEALKNPSAEAFPVGDTNKDIEQLTAASWRRRSATDDDEDED